MNANNVINDEMTSKLKDSDLTLEEKLAAIDAAVQVAQTDYNIKNGRPLDAPIDPADLTICAGCE